MDVKNGAFRVWDERNPESIKLFLLDLGDEMSRHSGADYLDCLRLESQHFDPTRLHSLPKDRRYLEVLL